MAKTSYFHRCQTKIKLSLNLSYSAKAQFEVSSLTIVPGGQHVKFPSKIQPLCRLLRQHNSHLWEFQLALMGKEPRRARAGSRCVERRQESTQTRGVIGLSHRLACFPMWATAVGRPRGTIWKQHDTLQCRTGIHGSGCGEQGQGPQDTKLSRDVSWLSKGCHLVSFRR